MTSPIHHVPFDDESFLPASPEFSREASNPSTSRGRRRPGSGPITVRAMAAVDAVEIAARLARLEELLHRRQIDIRETMLRTGPLELDLIDRNARRGGRVIDLLPREFCLLKYMIQHSDQLLTSDALLGEVWNYKFIPKTSNLVHVHMGRLHRKIDGPDETRMIHNVRGAGFILRTPAIATSQL
jgi:DNA-binding winged helix-turn-helix (wHTH) protein